MNPELLLPFGLQLHLGHYTDILTPPESHRFFGAGFLLLGVLLLVEVFAGKVWFRSKLRAAIFPLMAIGIGEGLIIVSFLDPQDRVVHFTTGLLVLVAGWIEMRYRSGKVGRFAADALVVPALIAAGFEMGVIHGRGDTITAMGHVAMGVTAMVMAGARLYEARDMTSVPRRSAMGVLIIILALILIVVQP